MSDHSGYYIVLKVVPFVFDNVSEKISQFLYLPLHVAAREIFVEERKEYIRWLNHSLHDVLIASNEWGLWACYSLKIMPKDNAAEDIQCDPVGDIIPSYPSRFGSRANCECGEHPFGDKGEICKGRGPSEGLVNDLRVALPHVINGERDVRSPHKFPDQEVFGRHVLHPGSILQCCLTNLVERQM